MSETLETFESWWCTECKSLCHVYEQGLVCACGEPWEEKLWEYPTKWVRCIVEVRKL